MLGTMFILVVLAAILGIIVRIFNEYKNRIIRSINDADKEAYISKFVRMKLYVKRTYAISLTIGIVVVIAAHAVENEILTTIGAGFIGLGFLCMLLQKFVEPPTASDPKEEP